MKKLFIIVLGVLMLLCFVACSEEKENTNNTTSNETTIPTLNFTLPDDSTAPSSAIEAEPVTEQETFYDNGYVEGPEYDPFEEMEQAE